MLIHNFLTGDPSPKTNNFSTNDVHFKTKVLHSISIFARTKSAQQQSSYSSSSLLPYENGVKPEKITICFQSSCQTSYAFGYGTYENQS